MATSLPSTRQAGREVEKRKDKISPYLEFLNQLREKCISDEDRKAVDRLYFLVGISSTEDLERAELLVEYCRSHQLEVTEYV